MKQGRDIWLRWSWRGIIPNAKITHWKGYVLLNAPLLLVFAIAYVTEQKPPFLVLYWIGALVFIAVYWALMLDHSEWERAAS